VSAVRGVGPRQVLQAVEAYFDDLGVVHARREDDEESPAGVRVYEDHAGWTTVAWPAYFAPRDIAACAILSRQLHTVASAVTTTPDEGWSHTVFGNGTVLDRFHSYPATLEWDGDDAAALAQEWAGDHELVARVFGVPACHVRRHYCQATGHSRDHPGRDRHGFVGLWAALGITYPDGRVPRYAALDVDRSWQRI
jgi:hypothetical protein